MKNLLSIAAIAGTMAFAPANATLVSFADYAASEGEHGVTPGTVVTIAGVSMELDSNHNPYFDGESGGLPAGLGVCKTLSAGAQCNPGSDDSIDADDALNPEYITINFLRPIGLTAISFRDAMHFQINDSTALVEYFVHTTSSAPGPSFDTFANVVALFAGGLEKVTSIGFRRAPGEGGDDFYIEALDAVVMPVPAALPLLLSGLAGLGFAARRKKAGLK